MVRTLGWSLYDIDQTDSESLLAFINRFAETEGGESGPAISHKTYCDQVDWL